MKTLLKVSEQTSWQLLGKAVSAFSTIIILGMIARSLGESEVGILTLALTYLSFFILISDFGLNAHILPRFIKGNINREWQKLLGLRAILTLVATLLAATLVFFWPDQSTVFTYTVLFGLFGVIQPGITLTTTAVFQSKLRFDLSVLASCFGSLVTLGLVWFFIRYGVGTPTLMVSYALGWSVTGVVALITVRKYISKLLPSFDFNFIKKTLLEVWPISAVIVLNLVYFRLDAFILARFYSYAEVGVYNLAYQIFQTLLVIPAFIMNSYYPLMLKNFSQDLDKFKINLTKACGMMLGAAVGGTILTIILAPWVIHLISGGKGFDGSALSLQILSLGFPAFFLSSVLMWTLIILRRYKTMLVIYLAGLIINILLNLIFIPQYSYFAASWVTVLSEYFILLAQTVILVKYLK